MQLGVYLDLRNPPQWRQDWSRLYGFSLELCEEAERLGLGSAWFSEHHLFADGYLPQPLTFAAAVAARTSRIRLGTAVMLAPLRPPAQIAEEAAVVDVLSGGRLDLGLGAGYRPPEFALYGADFTSRYKATDGTVRELRRLWGDGGVTPPPVQSALPIWLGYNGPQGARRAGRLGEGLLSLNPALLEPYREGLAEGGHDPAAARMSGTVNLFVSEDPERDWARVKPHHTHQWESYRQASVEGTGRPAPRPFDAEVSRARGLTPGLGNILVTTPEDAAAQLAERTRDIPVETVFVWVSPGALPEDLALAHLRSLGDHLAPLLKDL
ncbi:LLM class flavin-dependent oxidoreductase [Pseudonocardia sp. NPDC049154]|uniref:LLM class flavin-dependent oxidoreductase n=1 Tax=Pseudonocardia sp. NPDC049154 TaxID=3155501 RepID=UPI003402C12C